MDHTVLVLENPFDGQKLATRNSEAVTVIEIWCNDHIRNTRLVFHRDKDKPFGGSRALPRDHASCCFDKFPILAMSQFISSYDSVALQCATSAIHGMLIDCETCSRVVCD